MKQNKNIYIMFAASIIIMMLFSFINILTGSVNIEFKDTYNFLLHNNRINDEINTIIAEFKLPKLFTAITAGAALSVAGLLMQTIFRNPLAGPYVLGISSGASLGAAILIIGFASIFPPTFSIAGTWALAVAAWLGAAFVLLLVFTVSAKVNNVITVLVIGVLIGSAVSSAVSLMQYLGPAEKLKSFVLWTMGSLSGVTDQHFFVIVPAISFGFILAFLSSKHLDSLILGEDYAKTMGVNIITTRIFVFSATSLLAGTVTAFCGPIGFVGIVVPHLAKMIFKTSKHIILIPASAVIGANLIIAGDIIAQIPNTPGAVPINTVTAVLGIPVVIKIILDRKDL